MTAQIVLRLTIDQTNIVLEALGQAGPWVSVNPVIQSIQEQAQVQLAQSAPVMSDLPPAEPTGEPA